PSSAEKSVQTERRNFNWPPRKKITDIGEWRKESNAQTAVRHGVENPVGRGHQKKVKNEHEPSRLRWRLCEKSNPGRDETHQRKDKRMRQSPVTQHVSVPDSES